MRVTLILVKKFNFILYNIRFIQFLSFYIIYNYRNIMYERNKGKRRCAKIK